MPTEFNSIRDEAQLEDLLSEPTEGVIRAMGTLRGDLVVLGVAGKMGPTLARMAKRAFEAAGVKRRVIGVARFSSPASERQLEQWGVETIRCDLLDRNAFGALPDAENVVYMAGMKFGSTVTSIWRVTARYIGQFRKFIPSYPISRVEPIARHADESHLAFGIFHRGFNTVPS